MNQQFEMTDNQKYKYFHPTNEHDDALWSTLLALKNISLLTHEDIVSFSNPWQKQDEKIHGPMHETAKEVMFATNQNHWKRRSKIYIPMEFRRNRN